MTTISSQALTGASRQAVLNAQAQLALVQKELSSGSYADVGLTLGADSGQLLSLNAEQNTLQEITNNNGLVATRLSATQSALSSLQSTASSFLSSLTSATSAGTATSGVQATAAGNLQSMIAMLNTEVGGQYIFSGINTSQAPMQPYAAGSQSKTAVDDAFATALQQDGTDAADMTSDQMQSFLSGSFADQFSAANYATDWSNASNTTITSRIGPDQQATTSVTANASAFQKLAQAYTMVSEYGGSPLSTDVNQTVFSTAANLVSSAITDLINMQAGVGVTQSDVTASNDTMSAQIDLLTTQSGDMSQLSSTQTYDLTNQVSTLQTQIEASYEVTSKLQQMSLVNYLS